MPAELFQWMATPQSAVSNIRRFGGQTEIGMMVDSARAHHAASNPFISSQSPLQPMDMVWEGSPPRTEPGGLSQRYIPGTPGSVSPAYNFTGSLADRDFVGPDRFWDANTQNWGRQPWGGTRPHPLASRPWTDPKPSYFRPGPWGEKYEDAMEWARDLDWGDGMKWLGGLLVPGFGAMAGAAGRAIPRPWMTPRTEQGFDPSSAAAQAWDDSAF